MELLQLQYFQTIAKTQNISHAAKELHIAQPSLSQTLKRLEAEIGMPLFDRVGKRILLNGAGKIYLKYINEMFLCLTNAASELAAYQKTEDKTVCISIQSASFLLPHIVREIQAKKPEIQLQLLQNYTPGSSCTQGVLHISSSPRRPKDAHTILLMKESIGVIVPLSHPLASQKSICQKDLYAETFLALNDNSSLSQTLSYYFKQANFLPCTSTRVDSPHVLRDLLRMNLGIAFVPELTWKDFAADTLRFRKVTDLPMHRYMTLTIEPGRFLTSSMKECRDIILDYFTRYSLQFGE